jgi:hypothetical protein
MDFGDAVYAYSVRSKTNEKNATKLKELATKLKKPIWLIQAIDVRCEYQNMNSIVEICV